MAMKADDPRLEANRKKLFERVQKTNDLILAVLKNHLAVEQFMSEFLDASDKKDDELSFDEKRKLCKELNPTEIDPRIWELLEAINRLRNKIAHTFDQAAIQEKMDKLRATYLAALTPTQAKAEAELPDARIAASACEHCGGYLVVAAEATKERKKS